MHLVRRKARRVHRSLVTLQLPQERLLLRIKHLHSYIDSNGAALSDIGWRHTIDPPQHPTVVLLAVKESSSGMAKR